MPLLVLQRALARCEMRQEKLRALLRPHPSARLPRAAQRTRFCALLLEGVRTHAREQEGANEKRLSAAICLSAAISDKTAGKFRRQYSNNKGEGGEGENGGQLSSGARCALRRRRRIRYPSGLEQIAPHSPTVDDLACGFRSALRRSTARCNTARYVAKRRQRWAAHLHALPIIRGLTGVGVQRQQRWVSHGSHRYTELHGTRSEPQQGRAVRWSLRLAVLMLRPCSVSSLCLGCIASGSICARMHVTIDLEGALTSCSVCVLDTRSTRTSGAWAYR